MKRSYWLYTILRNGKYETIFDAHSNPIIFLCLEKSLGNETFLINQLEITKEEFEYLHLNKK
jgi:hypothetical protein